MRLLLVRHGESICSVEGIVGGERGCTGLTERGFAQARALRDRLTSEGLVPDVIVASTLPRAYQTADTIASGFDEIVERDAELCEFIPGAIDGRPWEEYTDRFEILDEPDRPLSPGGESLNVFRGRVRSVLERLAATLDGRTVLAVCHGGFIGTSFGEIFGIAGGERYWLDVDFTSITEWRRRDGRWHLVRFNDVAHLLGSDLLEPV